MRIISPIILIGFATLVTFGINSKTISKNIYILKQYALFNNFESSSKPLSTIDTSDYLQQDVNNIYKFLLANIALDRGQPILAKEHLEQLLNFTKDPQIAEILTELAIETEDYELLKIASQEWAELAKGNVEAQLMAVSAWLVADQSLVEKFLQQAIQADPEKIDSKLSALLPTFPEKYKKSLQQALKSLTNKNPNNPINQLCFAQVSAQLNNIKIAQQATKIALKLQPSLTNAIFLQAKLIRYSTKSDPKALNYLQQQMINFPKNEELQLFFANALIDNNKNIEALTILKKLFKSLNREIKLEANLLAAEIYVQTPTLNLNQAKICLNELINADIISSKIYFMLAQIAEKQGNHNEAIRIYTTIIEEPYHIVSFFRAALLLANDDQFSEAIEVLNQAQPSSLLEKKQLLLFQIELALELKDLLLAMNQSNKGLEILPNDIDFLYAHSIVASLNNQVLVAEKDLKNIINIQPDNHNALNALGFILTPDTNRQQEAFNYLQQALKLAPDNPTYMDSMGLLLYRMGKISDSLEILYSAYKLSHNLNIAVHLGEVLWESGKTQQAKAIWKKAWQADPNDEELINVLNQYQIIFLNPKNN